MNEMVELTELEKIEKLFKEFFGEEWRIELKDVLGQKYVHAEYKDAYDIEEIDVELNVNEYGVPTYIVYMAYANRDNEIPHCGACDGGDCENCWIFEEFGDSETGEIDIKKLSEYINEECSKHENKPSFELRDLSEHITVYPVIVEEYGDYDRYYKGVKIYAELKSIEKLESLLNMRHFLYSLIDCS